MTNRTTQFATIAAVIFTAADASADAALPQFDSSSFPNQLFWLVVTFVGLYLVVSKFVVPNVASVLEAREATIADAIAKAEAYKANADKAGSQSEAGTQDARARATELMAAAQADTAKAQAEAFAKLNATLEQQSAAASATLAKSVEAASGELEQAASDLARTMAEKLLGSSVDEASVKAARKAAA